MRLILISAAAAALAATPAMAGETHVDVHTGVGWNDGQSAKADVGIGVGYDFNISSNAFMGLEEDMDRVQADGAKLRFSTVGRLGTAIGNGNKVYALGGAVYGLGADGSVVGAGIEHSFGPAFAKLE
ncbi:MAG TPA: hypothetical protein VFF94_02425, partial [Novosphingobium sp.]|nr:hypothetical protein [Novosphingobium sp.]